MAKEGGLKKHGPIATVMEEVFGSPDNHEGDSGDCHDGVPGYPMGSGGKAPELTYVENNEWATVEKNSLHGKKSYKG